MTGMPTTDETIKEVFSSAGCQYLNSTWFMAPENGDARMKNKI